MERPPRPTHTLFINGGILGLRTFAAFIEQAFADPAHGIEATQVVLTDNLSLEDRLIRRILCARLWPDGLAGVRNLDFLRFRAEWHAGLLARRRVKALEATGPAFDVMHFHRQATAYALLDRMRQTPSIVSIDCTQRCVLDASHSDLERKTYRPNIRRDGDIFRAARLIISTSQWAADCIPREYPDCTTPVTVLRSPVPLDIFDRAWIQERVRQGASHRASHARPVHGRRLPAQGRSRPSRGVAQRTLRRTRDARSRDELADRLSRAA